MSRKASRYNVYPVKKYMLGVPIGVLFDEDELLDFMAAARRRIIATFHHATEPNPRYRPDQGMKEKRGTDNYIVGVADRQSELARHILKKVRKPFLSEHQLPIAVLEMHPYHTRTILQQARYDILLAQLNLMCSISSSNEIWYDEMHGVWQMAQSSIDDYVLGRRTARAALKLDERSYHGRNRSQSKARGIPEGVSVSFG